MDGSFNFAHRATNLKEKQAQNLLLVYVARFMSNFSRHLKPDVTFYFFDDRLANMTYGGTFFEPIIMRLWCLSS